MLTARKIAHCHDPSDTVTLTYEDRMLRRKVLTSDGGERFLVDLDHATSLGTGDAFALEDGRLIGVAAAPEALLEVTGDLPRLAWHIGNRHAPCQIADDRLMIRDDPVMRRMLDTLGASYRSVTAPFSPEGGAYGHGRTHGHQH